MTITTTVTTNGRELISSGMIHHRRDDVNTITISENSTRLEFSFKFESTKDGAQFAKVSLNSQHSATIVLGNFDNPLGTTLTDVQIATINGSLVFLNLLVFFINSDSDMRTIHYSVMKGDN